MAGIIHFANYYRYMEEAEHAFFRSLDLSIMQPQPDGSVIGWRAFRRRVRLRLRHTSRHSRSPTERRAEGRQVVELRNRILARREATGSWKTENRVLCLSARAAVGGRS